MSTYHYNSDDCLKKRQELVRKFYAQIAIIMARVDRLEERLKAEEKQCDALIKKLKITQEPGHDTEGMYDD